MFILSSCVQARSGVQILGRAMELGSTQPVTELSTRNISWREGGGAGVKAAGA